MRVTSLVLLGLTLVCANPAGQYAMVTIYYPYISHLFQSMFEFCIG